VYHQASGVRAENGARRPQRTAPRTPLAVVVLESHWDCNSTDLRLQRQWHSRRDFRQWQVRECRVDQHRRSPPTDIEFAGQSLGAQQLMGQASTTGSNTEFRHAFAKTHLTLFH